MQFNGQKLEEYCDISSGGTPSRNNPSYYNGHINWAAIADIEKSDGIVTETKEKITPEGLASIGNRIFPVGTLLLAMYGSVGKVAITGKEMATNQAILGIRPKHEYEVHIPYIKYWLIANQHKLVHKARGGILKNLSAKIVRNLKINLPKYDDQIIIANILSHVESLIVKREESIKLLDKLLENTFLDMFGDPVLNRKSWNKQPLEKLVSNDCLITYGIVQPGDEYMDGVPIVRPLDLNQSIELKYLKRIDPKISKKFSRTILNGDELLLTVRGTVGDIIMANKELSGANVTRGITPLRFDNEAQKIFFYFQIQSQPIQKKLKTYVKGAALQQINLRDLRNLELILPEEEFLEKFTTIAKNIELSKISYQESLKHLNNLFYSLSQLAFKGKLDLTKLKKNESENHQLIVDQPDSDNIIVEQNTTQGFGAWENLAKPILGGLALGMVAGLVYDIFTTKNEIKNDSNINDDIIKPQDFDEVYEAVARPISNTLEDGTTVSGFQIDEEGLFSLIKAAANDGTTFDDIQNRLYAKGHAIAYDENTKQRNAGLALKESVFKLLDNHELIQTYDEKRKMIVLKNSI